MNNRLINTKVAGGGGGGCTDIVDNYDPFGGGGVALYQLNGDALDSSPNAYNGTFTTPNYGTGVFGQAGVFNGSSSRLNIPNTIVNFSNAHTISLWFNPNSLSSLQGLFSHYTTYHTTIFLETSGSINFVGTVFSGTTVSINSWNNIIAINAGGTLTYDLYLNGSFLGSADTFAFNGRPTIIGAAASTATTYALYFNGSIDQVRIFDTALDPLEVEALYTEELCICDGTVDTLQVLGDTSCIATYQLDGNANDLSGNYSRQATNVSYGVGEFDLAGVFNGSSSYVNLPVLGLGGNATRSISAWVNPATTPSLLGTIYHSGGTAAKESFIIYYQSDNKIRVEYDNRSFATTTTILNNTWTHIVATYNGGSIESSANTKIYINGVLQTVTTSGSATGVANTLNTDYAIGYRRYANQFYFDGSIDQVRIFNKALDQDDVDILFAESACTVTYSNTEWGGAWDTVNSITSACSAGSSTLSFSNSNRTATESGTGFYVGAFSENAYNTFYLFGADAGGLTTKFTGNFTDDTFIYRPILEEGYYAEILMEAPDCRFGVTKNRVCTAGDQSAWYNNAIEYRNYNGQIARYNTVLATTATFTVGDIIGILLDDVAQTVTFYKNGAFIYTVNL